MKIVLSDADPLFVKEDILHITENRTPIRLLSHKWCVPILLEHSH